MYAETILIEEVLVLPLAVNVDARAEAVGAGHLKRIRRCMSGWVTALSSKLMSWMRLRVDVIVGSGGGVGGLGTVGAGVGSGRGGTILVLETRG